MSYAKIHQLTLPSRKQLEFSFDLSFDFIWYPSTILESTGKIGYKLILSDNSVIEIGWDDLISGLQGYIDFRKSKNNPVIGTRTLKKISVTSQFDSIDCLQFDQRDLKFINNQIPYYNNFKIEYTTANELIAGFNHQ